MRRCSSRERGVAGSSSSRSILPSRSSPLCSLPGRKAGRSRSRADRGAGRIGGERLGEEAVRGLGIGSSSTEDTPEGRRDEEESGEAAADGESRVQNPDSTFSRNLPAAGEESGSRSEEWKPPLRRPGESGACERCARLGRSASAASPSPRGGDASIGPSRERTARHLLEMEPLNGRRAGAPRSRPRGSPLYYEAGAAANANILVVSLKEKAPPDDG
ncbi:hypothetical protein KM043_006242 [Ampulex compressa]|nr:hypothetical protein KM043_006242 [Ampulex compressa]